MLIKALKQIELYPPHHRPFIKEIEQGPILSIQKLRHGGLVFVLRVLEILLNFLACPLFKPFKNLTRSYSVPCNR